MCDISLFWFTLFIILLLLIDLFRHRHAHSISFKSALKASAFWIFLALLFNVFVYICQGKEKALEYLAGYIVEKSLSVDNLFVFLVIFKYFRIDRKYQHKVLFWGVLGAIVFRALFIWIGLELVNQYHFILTIFALFLIYAGFKMMFPQKDIDPDKNVIIKLVKKIFPVTDQDNGRFFYKGAITPLFLSLVAIETSDILFALDSIPAVFAITRDPFIVYTSNIFAILGLRSLYFALSGLLDTFVYLHWALAAILIFVGVKMIIEPYYKVPVGYSLVFIFGTLAVAFGAGRENAQNPSRETDQSRYKDSD
ncbi:MAG: TerC family protein [Parachlamydiaceae bacterium]